MVAGRRREDQSLSTEYKVRGGGGAGECRKLWVK